MSERPLLNPYLRHDAHGPEMEARAHATHRGQAGWVAPELNQVCRNCLFWGEPGKHRRKGKWGVLIDQRCMKRRALGHKPGSKVPHSQCACKWFEQSASPPPEVAP
jgi:hypothetical protein